MKHVVEKAIESSMLRVLVVWTLMGTCMLAALLYAYWLNKAIFEAVQAKQVGSFISDLSSDLNSMQQKYLTLENAATVARAQELGFVETDTPTFVSRKPLGQGLSLRNDI